MVSNELIMETKRIGSALRVCAMDVSTGTEIIFQAPVNTSPLHLKRLASSKMRYVLKKLQAKQKL